MEDVAEQGRTVLFVSHNMAAVESLCTQAAILDEGNLVSLGNVRDLIDQYLHSASRTSADVDLRCAPGRVAGCTPVLKRLRVLDSEGKPSTIVPVGGDVVFEIHLATVEPIRNVEIALRFIGSRGERIQTCHTRFQHRPRIEVRGSTLATCILHNCRLLPGLYRLTLIVSSQRRRVDQIDLCACIEVVSRDVYGTGHMLPNWTGVIAPEARWIIEEK